MSTLSIIQVGNMTIKELIELLKSFKNPNAIVDMASDEEGNSFGDISNIISEEESKNGKKVYTGPRGGRYYINKNGNKTYIVN